MHDERYSSDGLIHDKERLKELQSLSLDRKIGITQSRIIEWYNHFDGNVYISLSGGKDSTVLLDITRKIFPDIPSVFSNTGLEYPEIRKFAKSFDNVDVVYPKMNFLNVIKTYGYPIISKEVSEAIYYARKNEYIGKQTIKKRTELQGLRQDFIKSIGKQKRSAYNKEKWLHIARDMPFLVSHYCCNVMKKSPLHIYERANKRYPFIATMAEESQIRKQAWIKHGCNAFKSKNKSSQPMSFWLEQDVLEYIERYNLPIASVYGEVVRDNDNNLCTTGCTRTGCIFCAFGCHLEKGETRFQKLAKTHPDKYEFCMGGGEWNDNPFYNPLISTEPDETGWVNWNPKKIWTPSKEGLGMSKVFDMLNDVYGSNFIRYK